MRRIPLLLAALLACGLIAAGCGDDDDGGDDDSPAATETAPAEAPDTDNSIDDAVDRCKRGVQATSGQLSEELRGDLEDLCEEAADGDEEDLRQANREICRRFVEEAVPDGPARDQALEACDNAATTP